MELSGIIGSSAKIQDVLRMVARLKNTRTPVLITGESGTGKELVARAIHFRGSLAHRPFVAVDCGALVPTLIESELFGYERGAFTGALKPKDGLFQAANGGTLFLDEIGELPLEMQTKLLRALQEKEVRRVGSNVRTQVDVRIVAATNRDLEQAYRDGTFRKDLYFRLNVVAVHLPALRERRSDIPSLVHFFLDKYVPDGSLQVSNAAMKALLQYGWPGNVRELQNCIERAVALGNRELIDVYDLPPALRNAGDQMTRALSAEEPTVPERSERPVVLPANKTTIPGVTPNDLEALERLTIQRVFDQVRGDKTLAGKMLGISRATLYRKIKRYQIKAASASA
jgi:transcriptional regulator with PAS, ATPase and Fis domain